MSILIDTCIWSLALRRNTPLVNSFVVQKLTQFIETKQVIMVGVIRQEILSGIQQTAQFERIRLKLGAFPDFPINTQDFETAAQFYNRCRAKGVQGSNTDFLLCAIAHRYNFTIFTMDKDFSHFKPLLDFNLYLWSESE